MKGTERSNLSKHTTSLRGESEQRAERSNLSIKVVVPNIHAIYNIRRQKMRNSKRIAIGIMVLLALIYFASSTFAVPSQPGDRAILGREGDDGLIEEMIILTFKPGEYDNVRSEVESGIRVVVLDKSETEAGIFYLVIEIKEETGRAGWVAEDYIHEITERPKF